MKWSNLPQPVAVRLLDLEQRVSDLVSKADAAESAMTRARGVINDRVEAQPGEYEAARGGFAAIHAASVQARQHADAGRVILASCRQWIENLHHNSKLTVVQSPAADLDDLGVLQGRLAGLREELRRLQGVVLPGDDVAMRVREHVRALGAGAVPWVRGVGEGDRLDVRWPAGADANPANGQGYGDRVDALALFALLQGEALVGVIMDAVQATLPMPRDELMARRAALPREIDELSFAVAALLDRGGLLPDPQMSPWHHLGVRAKDNGGASETSGGNGGKAATVQIAV